MDWMLDVLKETAEKFKPQIINAVRNKIGESSREYLSLFDHVFELFYSEKDSSGRWYDPYHVAYSTLFAVELVRDREASPLVVPAIILHDIGYHSLLVDKENWSSKNSRIIHMQEGTGMAAEILIMNGGFSASDVGAIVGMVASHDNGYLAIQTYEADRLALRDADRMWVMHPISFYKDWFSKKIKGENLSLLDLFRSRLVSFYGPNEMIPLGVKRTTEPDKEDAIQTTPSTFLARHWRDVQFESRFHEIQDNIVESLEHFRRRIEFNIQSELIVGRG